MQLRVCRLQFTVCSTGDVVITQSQTTGQTVSESFIQNHHGCKVNSLPSLAGIKNQPYLSKCLTRQQVTR